MTSKYVINGQAGVVGDYAHGSNFTVGGQLKENISLNDADLNALNEFIEKLNKYDGKEIKKSEVMNATLIMQELAEGIEEKNQEQQKDSQSKWKSFISKATPAMINLISVISSGVDVAQKVKDFLGIQ